MKPRRLRRGDRIALVAPASGCPREEVERGASELRRLGFEPVFSDAIFERAPFSAGAPDVRARDFLRAWSDPAVGALLAVRGGYGSVELLPLLQALRPSEQPKLFVGYSDTTSLLTWLTCQHGVPALHGPMIDRRLAAGPSAYDEASFQALLQGGAGLDLQPDGLEVIRAGEARGPLVGGTITQLAASLGTPFAFAPPEGAVLLLEDVNERPFRLHRMLTQLRLAGVFAKAAGLVFGEMPGCDDAGGPDTARGVIADVTRDFAGPVTVGFPSGHTSGPCWTVPLGVPVRLVAGSRPSLIVEESPVE
jgi:muramoyltetrapeptide carboxypeptidase